MCRCSQWCSYVHPDPGADQLEALQGVVRKLAAGQMEPRGNGVVEHAFGMKMGRKAKEWVKFMEDAYIWFDFASMPQPLATARPVAAPRRVQAPRRGAVCTKQSARAAGQDGAGAAARQPFTVCIVLALARRSPLLGTWCVLWDAKARRELPSSYPPHTRPSRTPSRPVAPQPGHATPV